MTSPEADWLALRWQLIRDGFQEDVVQATLTRMVTKAGPHLPLGREVARCLRKDHRRSARRLRRLRSKYTSYLTFHGRHAFPEQEILARLSQVNPAILESVVRRGGA